MILLYLWVDKFRAFRQQGFNFSSQFKFELLPASPRNSELAFDLTVSQMPGFYNLLPKETNEVSVVVGKNGAGKSTVLQLLATLYGNGSRVASSMIMSFFDPKTSSINTFYYSGEKRGRKKIRVTVYRGEDIPDEYAVYQAKSYTPDSIFGLEGRLVGVSEEFLEPVHFALLGNGFTQHPQELYTNIQNLSMSRALDLYITELLKKQTEKTAQHLALPAAPRINLFPTNLADFRFQQIEDWVKFIAFSKNKRDVPDFVPRVVTIKFLFDTSPSTRKFSPQRIWAKTHDQLVSRTLESLPLEGRNISRQRFSALSYLTLIVMIVDAGASERQDQWVKKINPVFEEFFSDKGNVAKSLEGLLTEVLALFFKNVSRQVRYDIFEHIQSAISEINFQEVGHVLDNNFIFQFPIDQSLLSLLQLFFRFDYGKDANLFIFSFGRGLSAGEEAKLNLYAQLHKVSEEARGRAVFLAIDEGDLYFHPEWQRTYLHDLFEVIEFLFKPAQLQLLLSTHSPFIVSDLPSAHLIYLDRINNEQCVVRQAEGMKQTFGTNIHELFMDNLFLNEGLMGEFATSKINALFKLIDDTKIIGKDFFIRELKPQIDLIGEPFLKAKLTEMVAEKVDIELLREIIQHRELEILNMILKSKENDSNIKR